MKLLDELMECCNEDCGWSGPLRECVEFKHGSRPFCPNCREVVEGTGVEVKREGQTK